MSSLPTLHAATLVNLLAAMVFLGGITQSSAQQATGSYNFNLPFLVGTGTAGSTVPVQLSSGFKPGDILRVTSTGTIEHVDLVDLCDLRFTPIPRDCTEPGCGK